MYDKNLSGQEKILFHPQTNNNTTDIQYNNKYFIINRIFIKLNVLKLPEKNYFCGGKF
jgi:hypothetical protein